MTKQTYVILGIVFIVLVLAGAVFVREKKQGSVEPITPPAPVIQPPVMTPTPPIVTPPTLPISPIAPTPEGWKTYRNEEFGFEIKYPSDYIIEQDKRDIPDFILRNQGNSLITAVSILPQGIFSKGQCCAEGLEYPTKEEQIFFGSVTAIKYNPDENYSPIKDGTLHIDAITVSNFQGIKNLKWTKAATILLEGNFEIGNQILATLRFLD